MTTQELHGHKLRPFEHGYAAFLKGVAVEKNPYVDEKETAPVSSKRWAEGWNKARREAGRKS